jgi:transcriptional regulator with XRE-family HTH domain/DNA-directed RNA polymerase subunit F
MGFLLRQARESKALNRPGRKPKKFTQTELARRVTRLSKMGGVSQPTVSNLEGFDSLDRSFEEGNRPGTRETLIEIATLGLRLPQTDVDALLWLFEGDEFRPLDEAEIRYCYEYAPQSSPRRYDDDELRRHVLSLIDGWLAVRNARSTREVEARMITEWDESGQLEFREELLNLERGPGQRMMFGKYPSLLTYPHSLSGRDEAGHDLSLSEEGREASAAKTDERRAMFLRNLDVYGERCIHSTESLTRYLSSEFQHRLGWSRRKEQVENLINLLGQYERYEIALANIEPETEVEIKSTVAACLRATEKDTYYWRREPVICGPLYIYWYDVTTVFSFYRQFERAWDSIADERRDKNFVVEFLKAALNDAR